MENNKLLEKLSYHLNEDGYGKLEVILRNLIADEEQATAGYLKAAHKVAEKAEEKGDSLGLKIAKVFKDLANEEKVHIGELKKCLELIGVSDKEQQEGENEVEEIIGNVGEV